MGVKVNMIQLGSWDGYETDIPIGQLDSLVS